MTRLTYHRLGTLIQSILDAIESCNDTLVAGDLSLLDWNVEVNTEIKL